MKPGGTSSEFHVVTGAFGYSGKYIAARLIEAGHRVRTLTNSLERANPFGNQVQAFPFSFDNPAKLAESLNGAAVLYNTYWVRFNYGDFSRRRAIENSLKLFEACRVAGVSRVVHVSITNPSLESPLEYFRGKAQLERALTESGSSYAILRPAVLFGREDILINNIAWCLRRLPVFGVFGDGQYKLQPIYVDDLAQLAIAQGAQRSNAILDAIGPETFTYRELVRQIGAIIGKRRPMISVPPSVGFFLAQVLGKLTGDVLITRDEIQGLMQNLLCTHSPPLGTTRLTNWTREHADTLGRKYASELTRRKNRKAPYEAL